MNISTTPCLMAYFDQIQQHRGEDEGEPIIPTYYYIALVQNGIPLTPQDFLNLTIGQTELLLTRIAELNKKLEEKLSGVGDRYGK